MYWRKKFYHIISCMLACVVCGSAVAVRSFAAEQPDIVRMELPVVYESGDTPFDFHLDPQGLIYLTDAALYGGGLVEEGASLLFRNTQGDYSFSSRSDQMTLTNRGDSAVTVYVEAQIGQLGEIGLAGDPGFSDMPDHCAVYLAIVDDEGNETPLSELADAPVSFTLSAGDSYAFGLTGSCNTDADWSQINESPSVRVTWRVEAVETEEEDPSAHEDLYQETLPTEPYGEAVPEESPEGGTTENPEANTQKDTESNTEGTTEGPVPAGNAGSSATSDAGKPVGTETQTGSTQGGNSHTGTTQDNPSQTGGAQNNSSQESSTMQNTSGEGSVSGETAASEGMSN